MPGRILTTASTIMCPHGGQATLTTSNTSVLADSAPVLLESDIHTVAGCPFTLPGPKPSPCVRIEWSAGASSVTVDGTPVLIESSMGRCISPEGAPQGLAVIVNTQVKGSAR